MEDLEIREGDAPSRARQYDWAKRNRFLAALPGDEFSMLASHLRTVPLERGATLHDHGDDLEYVYFPYSGMISLVCVMKDGATVETATLGRGGVIGATAGLGSRHAFCRPIVQISGETTRIARSSFHLAVDKSSAIRDLVVRYNDLLLSQIQQSVACNALHRLEARLCRWLLQVRDCIDDDPIPFTQEFMAQMLGVRRTALTVIARVLQARGLIRYQRGRIHILNGAALEQSACECYGVIKGLTDAFFAPPALGGDQPRRDEDESARPCHFGDGNGDFVRPNSEIKDGS
jgi:CRP-like cAMP-binding protein